MKSAEQIISEMEAAVASGTVWNADLEEWKFSLGNYIYRDTQATLWPAMRNGVDEALGYPSSPSSLHDIRGFSNAIERARKKKGVSIPEAVDAYLCRWLPARDLLDAAKPLIRKGRRPSEQVSDAERRTLENTGTCPVCERNHKREPDGGMVHHGYELRWNERQGGCFGVGYQPWEVSPEGKQAFLVAVTAQRERAEATLASLKVPGVSVWSERKKALLKPDEEFYGEALRNRTRAAEWEVKDLTSLQERLTKQIESWEAATLPGISAGFTR